MVNQAIIEHHGHFEEDKNKCYFYIVNKNKRNFFFYHIKLFCYIEAVFSGLGLFATGLNLFYFI